MYDVYTVSYTVHATGNTLVEESAINMNKSIAITIGFVFHNLNNTNEKKRKKVNNKMKKNIVVHGELELYSYDV